MPTPSTQNSSVARSAHPCGKPHLGWFTLSHCGVVDASGSVTSKAAPDITSTDAMLAFIERPLKYYPRMTTEARFALGATHLALTSLRMARPDLKEIGVLAAGFNGTLEANQNYFRDYLASGRTMGRGNLFIYTLPTSALGEVAIALGLTGPTMHLHADAKPIAAMLQHANRLIADGEAQAILCLWTDSKAAVCLAVDENTANAPDIAEMEPFELAESLAKNARSK
jgi:3-oxoacyl-(acyl-carrier-protein) synthase